MDAKLGIALILSALVALSMPARTGAEAGDPTPIDFINIGDPTSEAGHNLAGWGPIEPIHSGGTWGGAGEDGNCRVISSGYDDGTGLNHFLDWAEFTMDFGDSPGKNYLLLRHLDGYAQDSFYVYIDAPDTPGEGTEVFYWPDQQSQDEIWRTTQIPLDLTGVHTVTLLSDRRKRAPYGLAGGEDGKPGEDYLVREAGKERLPSKVQFKAEPGDVIEIHTPGGGGFGPPA